LVTENEAGDWSLLIFQLKITAIFTCGYVTGQPLQQ
jgi:hypothetical protein